MVCLTLVKYFGLLRLLLKFLIINNAEMNIFFFRSLNHCTTREVPIAPFFFKEIHGLLFIYLFIYLWLCWAFVSVRGLSPAAASGDHSSSRCAGLSPSRPLLLRSTGSRRAGSAIVAHGPSCSAACGILPDQGSNPCPPHWQADSQPLHHQGSPWTFFCANSVLYRLDYFYKTDSQKRGCWVKGENNSFWQIVFQEGCTNVQGAVQLLSLRGRIVLSLRPCKLRWVKRTPQTAVHWGHGQSNKQEIYLPCLKLRWNANSLLVREMCIRTVRYRLSSIWLVKLENTDHMQCLLDWGTRHPHNQLIEMGIITTFWENNLAIWIKIDLRTPSLHHIITISFVGGTFLKIEI